METSSSQICVNLPIYQPPRFNSFSTQSYDLSLQQHPVFSFPPTFAQPLLQIFKHDMWLRNTETKYWWTWENVKKHQRSIREVLWDRINNILNLLSTLCVSSVVLGVLCVLTHFGNELWAHLSPYLFKYCFCYILFFLSLWDYNLKLLDILLYFIYCLYFPSFFQIYMNCLFLPVF